MTIAEHPIELDLIAKLGEPQVQLKRLALMDELLPLLHMLAQGRQIDGLAVHEEGR